MSSRGAEAGARAIRWWRRAWQRRVAYAQALILMLAMVAMLIVMDRMMAMQRADDADRRLLDDARWVSLWIDAEAARAGADLAGTPDTPDTPGTADTAGTAGTADTANTADVTMLTTVLAQRLGEVLRGRGDLQVSILAHPAQTAPVTTDIDRDLIRRQRLPHGDFDVLEWPLAVTDTRTALDVKLMRPLAPQLEQQASARWMLASVGLCGVALVLALGWLSSRWSARRLRRLSRSAQRLVDGGRIPTRDVDAELLPLVTAFNATLDELQAAHRQSEGFSADVAHELRSPLATLIGGTQFVLSRPRSNDVLRDALASNLEELESLKNLVNDMLFLARADRGERAQSLQRADLGDLADATIDYCAALFEDAGLSVQRLGTASAVCNAALIRRAIANLLSNACQHADGERRVTLHLLALPGKVRIWVFNSGDPLTAEVTSRMFDRFYRANAARTDHGAHHGLGLAIVQAVARMHGGTVFARARADGNEIGLEIPGALASSQRRVRDRVHEIWHG